MSQEDREKEKEIISIMTKYFVPIDTTDLPNVVPENDRILCSLMCAGKLATNTPPVHVLLTNYGIAYRFLSTRNKFVYWHSRPQKKIKFGKARITVNNFKMSITKKLKKLYTEKEYELIQEGFIPYCSVLSHNFQNQIDEIMEITDNIEMIESKISNIGISNFINTVHMIYSAGFMDNTLLIIENTLEFIPNGEKNPFLLLFAEIYSKKTEDIERQFDKDKRLSEMILPHYKKIIEIYDSILEQDPINTDILKKIDKAQSIYNYYTIPQKDREKAYDLYLKGINKYFEEKQEEALNCFKESYQLNPYSSELKSQIINLLKELGKSEEIKDY